MFPGLSPPGAASGARPWRGEGVGGVEFPSPAKLEKGVRQEGGPLALIFLPHPRYPRRSFLQEGDLRAVIGWVWLHEPASG